MNQPVDKTTITQLSTWGVITVTGKDTIKFLQGQLTQDITTLSETTAAFSAYLTPKGRVIADFVMVYLNPNKVLLIMPKSIIPAILEKLGKYALFSKVTLTDTSIEYNIFGLFEQSEQQSTWSVHQLEHDIIKVHWAQTTLSLLLTPSQLSNDVLQKLIVNYSADDDTTWQLTLIENKFPIIDAKNIETFTIHDLGLEQLNAVNFKKGCYTGQEIVARMHYKAKLKQHLYLLSLNTDIACNQIFVDGNQNEIGRVVNIAPCHDKFKALVWLRDDALNAVCLMTAEGKEILFELLS